MLNNKSCTSTRRPYLLLYVSVCLCFIAIPKIQVCHLFRSSSTSTKVVILIGSLYCHCHCHCHCQYNQKKIERSEIRVLSFFRTNILLDLTKLNKLHFLITNSSPDCLSIRLIHLLSPSFLPEPELLAPTCAMSSPFPTGKITDRTTRNPPSTTPRHRK